MIRNVLACVMLASLVGTASAQPASALGKPLPDAALAVGTITVRVVAGAATSPVPGAEVTLVVAGAPRSARTDSSGRATFSGLPAGATVQAKISDADGKDITAEPFPIPASGGVRVMLTTKPFTGSGGAGAMPPAGGPAAGGAGAAGGMPEARQMSGQPRPDQGVPAGTYQVRLTYNNLVVQPGGATDAQPPVGETVTLVGYTSDDAVNVRTMKIDAQGLAVFDGLDVSGHTNYFAMARLPRSGGSDRLVAMPVQPDPQVGIKLILSGEKRDSTGTVIDELTNQQSIATPAGKVRVTLDGFPQEASPIKLIDANSAKVIGTLTPSASPPDTSNVEGAAPFTPDPALPKGTLAIKVHGGAGADDNPLPNIPLRVVPADAPPDAPGIPSQTGADGSVQLTVPASDKPYKVVVTVNGKQLSSSAFDLSASGGRLDVLARWEAEGRPQAMFDVPYDPALVLYAETRTENGLTYRSLPFQLVETMGAHVGVTIYPRVMVRFSMRAFVEDDLLAVRGQFAVENNSWQPYAGGKDGMVIQLPYGFVGAAVADESQADVAVAPGEGYRILRPLPPGRKIFAFGFSLKSEGGVVDWKLDLPLGTFQSELQIKHNPGLRVDTPGMQPEMVTSRDNQPWFALQNITIRRGESMVMTISGLPAQAAWKLWAPRLIGALVLLVMVGGVAVAVLFRRRHAPVASVEARRTALLDELVALEKTVQPGVASLRRDQVLAELETLWRA